MSNDFSRRSAAHEPIAMDSGIEMTPATEHQARRS